MATRRTIVLWLLGSMTCLVHAAGPTDDDAPRRAQLAAERAAAHARYEQAVRECGRSFAVSGCVGQAKAERRATLDKLNRSQAVLDDAARRRRAEERRQRIAAKQQAVAERQAASAPQVQTRPPRAASMPHDARPPRRAEPRASEAAAAASAAAAAEAAQRRAQAQQRRERAQEHAEAVRRRNEERALQRAPAAPLPLLPASTVAR